MKRLEWKYKVAKKCLLVWTEHLKRSARTLITSPHFSEEIKLLLQHIIKIHAYAKKSLIFVTFVIFSAFVTRKCLAFLTKPYLTNSKDCANVVCFLLYMVS